MHRLKSLALLSALLCPSLSARAADIDVEVGNARSIPILELYVGLTGDSKWAEALLGESIKPDWSFTVVLDTDDGCRYDFEARFADGSKRASRNFEVCDASKITLVFED